MNKFSGCSLHYVEKLINVLHDIDHKSIDNAVEIINRTWKDGGQIITLGNGGSSLTALHFINDWNKSVYLSHGIPFRGRSLVDNVGLLMSYANDISFEDVFVEQLKNMLTPGDLVIAISGSGNSENVIRAVEYANNNQGVTLGLCGYDGGKLKQLAAHHVWIKANDMQLAEDLHSIFGHIVMQSLCA